PLPPGAAHRPARRLEVAHLQLAGEPGEAGGGRLVERGLDPHLAGPVALDLQAHVDVQPAPPEGGDGERGRDEEADAGPPPPGPAHPVRGAAHAPSARATPDRTGAGRPLSWRVSLR